MTVVEAKCLKRRPLEEKQRMSRKIK